MKKFFAILLFTSIFFIVSSPLYAQTQGEYAITNFVSDIVIENDTSISVTEKVEVHFPHPKHGIYRNVPYVYSANGKTLHTNIRIKSVTDEIGNKQKYETKKENGSFQIKIGDPDVTVIGDYQYIISYNVSKVIQRYDDHDELYWNVTGSQWDTNILTASATVRSPYAQLTKVDCFAGLVGTNTKDCTLDFSDSENASFATTRSMGYGSDFTIVVGLSKDSQIVFPGFVENLISTIIDNSAYFLSFIPFFVFGYLWWKRGRDQKYAGENIYYKPDSGKVVTKPLFYREHLPMVYSPIQSLSPSEIGTLVDQKVDVNDVVAEITELARLGYMKIEKLEKDKQSLLLRSKLIGKDTDYVFIKLRDDSMRLKDYQTYLFEAIFRDSISSKSVDKLSKILKNDKTKLSKYIKLANESKLVVLSALQTDFYSKLSEFKTKLYKEMSEADYFDGPPNRVREKWIAYFVVVSVISFWIVFSLSNQIGNFWPVILFAILEIPTFIFVYSIPRRLPWGYSLYRQIEGLAFYLKKGKWREEIAEKQLFFSEMLPIAISLRIVDKLSKDMDTLGIPAPSYMSGFAVHSFARDFSAFESKANAIAVAPSGKSGSWSGGSGFSGGSSGGGMGGGGGGSW